MFPSRFVQIPNRQSFLHEFSKCAICLLTLIILIFSLPATAARAQSDKTRKQAEKAMRSGDFDAAEALWQKVLQSEAQDTTARSKLSYALYKQRRFVKAYEEAVRVLKTDPQNARVRALIGAVYLEAGRFQVASEILRIALSLNPDEPLALANSALLDFYNNLSHQSLVKLRRATYLEPNEPDFFFARAQVAARSENYREAADAYERFLRIATLADADRRARIQGLIAFLRYLGSQKKLYDVGGERQTKVNCEIVNNRPVIEVRVDGKAEPLRFVLDTGSGMTVLSEETAARLGINPVVQGGMARAIGGGGKFQIVYGFLKSIEIGAARVANVPIYIRKFNNGGDKIDGYIGLSVISKYLTTLDYGDKTFALARNTSDDHKNAHKPTDPASLAAIAIASGSSVPLRITSSGFLSSEVRVDGVEEPLNFIIDTGASISVVSNEAAKRGNINSYAQATMMRVFGAAGVVENVATLLLPRLQVGDVSREKISVAVLDLQPVNETSGFEQAGILGGNFLLHYRLTFDFQNASVIFEPTAAKNLSNEKVLSSDDNPPD